MAIYPQARVLRYAAFMGLELMELDFISSHGRQALRYARTHGLRCDIMHEAFATADHIKAFRESLALPSAKLAVNMLVGGAGLAKVKLATGVRELPRKLQILHAELSAMRKHMMDNCPGEWKETIAQSERPSLTLGSWHYQLGERKDLDLVTSKLPPSCRVHGWLGDSILVSSFDAEAFCDAMREHDIVVSVRHFPKTPEEYFASFKNITGHDFDQRPFSPRQQVRLGAYNYGRK
jgi:hypothetical protein